jgi:hypothetical protein
MDNHPHFLGPVGREDNQGKILEKVIDNYATKW